MGRRPKGTHRHIKAAYSDPMIRAITEARWFKAHCGWHPELDKSKSGRWSDDYGIWLADGVAGKELGEGRHKSKTISSLHVMDGDTLIQDFFCIGPNCAHIKTPTEYGVLLQPNKDRRSFDTYCTTRDGYRAKALKPPRCADSTGIFAGKMYRTHKPLRAVDLLQDNL